MAFKLTASVTMMLDDIMTAAVYERCQLLPLRF